MTFADLVYKFFAYLYNNKQAILGGLVAALSFIQASPDVKDLLDPVVYRWVMLGVGLIMILFARSASGGMVSSVMPKSVPAERAPPPQPPAPPEAGFARPSLLVAIIVMMTAVACTQTMGAYKTADTLDEQAYVLTEHYAALVHEAADLKENASTPQEVKDALRDAANASAPFVLGDETKNTPSLKDLAKAYQDVKTAETRDALQKALDAAILKVAEFVRAVKKAQADAMTAVPGIGATETFAMAGGE